MEANACKCRLDMYLSGGICKECPRGTQRMGPFHSDCNCGVIANTYFDAASGTCTCIANTFENSGSCA